MTKFLPSHTKVVFAEIPDEITLAISITGCVFHCPGCHSKELWEESGEDLTKETLLRLIEENTGITCVCFMGEGLKVDGINARARMVKKSHPELRVALYTGRIVIPESLNLKLFDYVKVGPYMKEKGPLNKPTTNQRLYSINKDGSIKEDITYKFWKKK